MRARLAGVLSQKSLPKIEAVILNEVKDLRLLFYARNLCDTTRVSRVKSSLHNFPGEPQVLRLRLSLSHPSDKDLSPGAPVRDKFRSG
jgi:hypothetical protein